MVPDHGWFLQICLSMITRAGLEIEREIGLIMIWANCDNEASMLDYAFLFIFWGLEFDEVVKQSKY